MSQIRLAIRSLLRDRWFTMAAVLPFAVGIGIIPQRAAALESTDVLRVP